MTIIMLIQYHYHFMNLNKYLLSNNKYLVRSIVIINNHNDNHNDNGNDVMLQYEYSYYF